jgi:hypothetical protein
MSEQERMLVRVGKVLEQVARPHPCDAVLPAEVLSSLWQLGFPCTEVTRREELIPRLWARKRTLQLAVGTQWNEPWLTPPSAA